MKNTNHLSNETSPYLKQHAHNPVDWYPWGLEALEKARQEKKPILLSIGYAACHWCHVMAHESFEDQETAELMNQFFVNIKVDKEERPDLDKIYQSAHYLLSQRRGGWPLTIFLTPDDLAPFFSGTYYPLTSKYHLPAFKDILKGVAELYQNRFADIKKQNADLIHILQQQEQSVSVDDLNQKPVQLALKTLSERYDPIYGGFSNAPKFPQSSILEFLCANFSNMAAETLLQMANGGIYDQLAGGFFRYSIDNKWEIPHFEKMLYDNAQLLFIYTYASKVFDEPTFADIARETGQWIINTMQSPEGGFYSSIDADSEGHEGKFYIWDITEINKSLSSAQFDLVSAYFGLNEPPNFENHWHLHVAQSLEKTAKTFNFSKHDANSLLNAAKQTLLAVREKRISPLRDEKILTAWNGLTIKSLLTAGIMLNEPSFITQAEKAIQCIHKKLWQHNRLLASYTNGKAHVQAYLDDYAFLLDALLSALQITWNKEYLAFAIDLADTLLTNFWDQDKDGFFFTANDHEKLLYRPKLMMDEAIPSGNGIAARALLTLGHLLGETRYLSAAEKTLQTAWPLLSQFPAEHATLLLALKDWLVPPPIIVIRGPKEEMHKWQEACLAFNRNVFAIPSDEKNLPGLLHLREPRDETCAYICEGHQCLEVITTLDELRKAEKLFPSINSRRE